jgi:hypothetical protein
MSQENPIPGNQTPPAGAWQPAYPAYPTYPAHPTYPAYPGYGSYPSYGYAGAPPQPGYAPPFVPPLPVLPPVPSRAPDRPGRQRLMNLVLAVVLAGVTAGALALAAAAPSLVTRDPGPPTTGGFQQIYNSALRDDSAHWDVGHGCVFENGGLHATNGSTATLCLFTPSHQTDYTSGGFYLTTHIAPPSAVSSVEAACVQFDSGSDFSTFAIDQYGHYALLSNPSDACSVAPPTGLAQQETAAWHAAGDIANDLSLRYDAGSRVITVYVNGQQILSEGWLFGGPYAISLGTAAGDEAIYTSFGLWSVPQS